ncbi:MAG TPA: TlpA disulfide reductase family protein [Streptosporangiaceae bacterium]|nr:TlpA disulfide reductase family protein [Streptosporangiaceae bacterium]
MTRLLRARDMAARTTRILRAVLAGSALLAASSCSGGALAQNTPLSSGQSFVEGSFSSTYFSPGSRPAAPAVKSTLLTGQRFSLAADRGTVVVLNFWGSWCAPCRQEAPALAALARYFPQNQVRFVGVDIRDSVSSAEAFQHTFNVGYSSLNDPRDEVALAFQGSVPPAGIPTTLLIDRTGHIAARVVGGVSYSGLRALIAKVLAERP